MWPFNKLFKKKKIAEIKIENTQAVIIRFHYGLRGLKPVENVIENLKSILSTGRLGEFEGYEIAVDFSEGRIFMVGPDAEKIFTASRETLQQYDFMKGATIYLRFGPEGDESAEEIKFPL